jgi:hypothetical protein
MPTNSPAEKSADRHPGRHPSLDGRPIALGYHTGHWEIGLQMSAAAKEITRLSGIPFAAFVSDPCDGRSQGTHGMFDSCRTVTTRPSSFAA